MFIVQRCGIQRRDILFVKETFDEAKKATEKHLEEVIANDKITREANRSTHFSDADGWHSFEVVHLIVNKEPETVACYSSEGMHESAHYEWEKMDA